VQVEFLARGGADLRCEEGEVGGGLEFDFAVGGVHFGGIVGRGCAVVGCVGRVRCCSRMDGLRGDRYGTILGGGRISCRGMRVVVVVS